MEGTRTGSADHRPRTPWTPSHRCIQVIVMMTRAIPSFVLPRPLNRFWSLPSIRTVQTQVPRCMAGCVPVCIDSRRCDALYPATHQQNVRQTTSSHSRCGLAYGTAGICRSDLAYAVCIEASHVFPPLPSVTVEKLLGQGFTPTPRTAPCGRPCYQPAEFER